MLYLEIQMLFLFQRKKLDNVNWWNLFENPNAIHILEKNLDKVDWRQLSFNPNAIPILEKNLDKVNWNALSRNPNAIPILEKHPDKINWVWLSSNKNAHLLLSKLDYPAMKVNTKSFAKELTEYVFHPERLNRICEGNDLQLCDLLEIL